MTFYLHVACRNIWSLRGWTRSEWETVQPLLLIVQGSGAVVYRPPPSDTHTHVVPHILRFGPGTCGQGRESLTSRSAIRFWKPSPTYVTRTLVLSLQTLEQGSKGRVQSFPTPPRCIPPPPHPWVPLIRIFLPWSTSCHSMCGLCSALLPPQAYTWIIVGIIPPCLTMVCACMVPQTSDKKTR